MVDSPNDRRVTAEVIGRPRPAQGSLAAELGLPEPAMGASVVRLKRGPGRPRGSVARRQEEVARWLKDQYGDPLERLAAAAAIGVAEWQQRLGCTFVEAAQFWRELQKDLLPYHHTELPKRLEISKPLAIPEDAFTRTIDHEPAQ